MTGAPAPLARLRSELLAGPDLFPHKLDIAAARVLFVRLSAEVFRQASFLDERVITPQTQGTWVRFAHLDQALAGAGVARPLHFIFHLGHVGSTLLSRLLEDLGGVLALREPLPLRSLAEAHDALGARHALVDAPTFDRLTEGQTVLWSRGYPDTRAVVVKATSAGGRIAPQLLAARPEARAVYLHLAAPAYLATLLAGEESPVDLRGHGPERMQRLDRLAEAPAPQPLHAMSPGELAAMAWTVETMTLQRAVGATGGRAMPVDFETLLGEPAGTLRAACAHLGIEAAPDRIDAAVRGPALARYAKATERPYSPQTRAEILARSRADNADEIRKGLLWIEAFARRSPAAAAALTRPSGG